MINQIGTVTIEYNRSGVVTSHKFNPLIKVDNSQELRRELKNVNGENADVLKHNADVIVAAWFSKVNQVELEDREQYSVESEVIACEKYNTGGIKKCVLKYFLKKH